MASKELGAKQEKRNFVGMKKEREMLLQAND